MLIKVKIMPDNEITGDMGTCYIISTHQGFIEALETINDYKVMACFLDANKLYYHELIGTPSHFDKEIDVTPSVMIAIKDNDTDFMDKIIDETKIIVPTFKTDDMDENEYKMRRERNIDFKLRCLLAHKEILIAENERLREKNQRLKEELKGFYNA